MSSTNIIEFRVRQKQRVVEYLGGSCVFCGYKTTSRSLQCHHVDPDKKAFGLSVRGITRSLERVLIEANKCILVCANCHGEIHDGVISHKEVLIKYKKTIQTRPNMISFMRQFETKVKPGSKYSTICECGKQKSKGAIQCRGCHNRKGRQKIIWPSLETIKKMVIQLGWLGAGRELGVSDNAIRKHLKTHGINIGEWKTW